VVDGNAPPNLAIENPRGMRNFKLYQVSKINSVFILFQGRLLKELRRK